MKRLAPVALTLGIVSLSAFYYFQNKKAPDVTRETIAADFYVGKFGIRNYCPTFRGWVNGCLGHLFIDSGSDATLDLEPSFAELSKVKVTGKQDTYGFDGTIKNQLGKIESLAIGAKEKLLTLNQEHKVRISSEGKTAYEDGLLQGYLGNKILVPHGARIDYGSGKLTLYKEANRGEPQDYDSNPKSAIDSGNKIRVPFVMNSGGVPHINAKIGDAEGFFGVDTGCTHTILTPEFLLRAGISESGKMNQGGSIQGQSGVLELIEISEVTFGTDRSISSPFLFAVLCLNPINEGIVAHGERPLDGIIGSDFLMNYKASIDYDSHTITFSRTGRSSLEAFFMEVRCVLNQILIEVLYAIENESNQDLEPQSKSELKSAAVEEPMPVK